MELIDRDELELFLKTARQGLFLDKTIKDFDTRDNMLLNFRQYVHLQPIVDAVPVVRCCDCEHWVQNKSRNKDFGMCAWLRLQTRTTLKDSFCSDGKRKEKINDNRN